MKKTILILIAVATAPIWLPFALVIIPCAALYVGYKEAEKQQAKQQRSSK